MKLFYIILGGIIMLFLVITLSYAFSPTFKQTFSNINPFQQSSMIENVKIYDSETKEITITDTFGSDLLKIKLNTPLNFYVPRGYQKVAEFTLNMSGDYYDVFNKIEFYDEKDAMKVLDKSFDYKVKTIIQEEIEGFYMDCDYHTGSSNCTKVITGNYTQDKVVWNDIIINKEFRERKVYTIGIFTDVQKGDKIEWIPTILDIIINEWATWTESLNTDLLVYYTLNETSGTIVDSVGNANMTNSGMHQGKDGMISYGINHDGDGGDDAYTSASLGVGGDMAICLWFNSTLDNAFLAGEHQGGTTGNWFALLGHGGGYFKFGRSENAEAKSLSSYNDGAWHFGCGIYDDANNNVSVYVDGVIDGSMTDTNSIGDTAEEFRIGDEGAGTFPFFGNMDEVAVWNRTLSASEISDLYNGGAGITYTVGVILSHHNITLTNPTTESPVSVSSFDNISVEFNFVNNVTGNVTSGVTFNNITIGGVEATIVGESIEADSYPILYEDFENDWETTTNSACDSTPNAALIGNFNNADGNSDDYRWCATSESGRNHEGSYGLNLEDWDGGTETSTDGIWYNFNPSTSCNSGQCNSINVGFWAWEVGMDAGEACWVTQQIGTGTPTTLETLAQPINSYTYFTANLTEGALSESSVNIRIMCDMGATADETYMDEFNITGFITASSTTEFGYVSDKGWQVNVTVPDFASGLKDLIINVSYAGANYLSTESNSVNYGGTADTTFTVTYPGSTSSPYFNLTSRNDKELEAQNQTSDIPIFNISNEGNVILDIKLLINASASTDTILIADDDNTIGDGIIITTSAQTIKSSLGVGDAFGIWLWTNVTNYAPRSEQRDLNISVAES